MFGFKENTQQTSSFGKFGLNQKAYITKLEFNPNGGANNTPREVLDVTIQLGEKTFMSRYGLPLEVRKDGNVITDTNSQEYKTAMEIETGLISELVTQFARCFVPVEDLKTALSAPINTFKDFINLVVRLVNVQGDFTKVPVDIFLQYQWSINTAKGSTSTFLELPKNTKQGLFVCKHVEGDFKEVTTDGLKYVDAEGNTHPFKRSKWFMQSNWAKRQTLDNPASTENVDNVFNNESADDLPF